MSSWLRETDIASTWLSLDEGDNDPVCFLQYFLSALHKIVPTIQLDLLDMLHGTRPAQADVLLNCLINEIAEKAISFVLVLDDFHVIRARPILEMLAFLLDHLPPQMHLVCLIRTDPDLPLARLRVRDQLVDIRAEQFHFTLDEIAVWLIRCFRGMGRARPTAPCLGIGHYARTQRKLNTMAVFLARCLDGGEAMSATRTRSPLAC